MFDLIIRNAKLLSARKKQWQADIAVKDGKIAEISTDKAKTEIDASDADTHNRYSHLR